MGDRVDLSAFTLAVLAGGRGQRMGQAKGNLTVGEKPILQFLLERWRWPGPTMLITAPGREHPPGAGLFHVEHSDPDTGEAAGGPLRGVHTALEHLQTPGLVIVTVDMPGVQPAQLSWMVERLLERPGCVGLMLERAVESTLQVEPFPLVCRAAAKPIVAAGLESGRRSVARLREAAGFVVLPAPGEFPAATWTNLNEPADYAAFIASLGSRAV